MDCRRRGESIGGPVIPLVEQAERGDDAVPDNLIDQTVVGSDRLRRQAQVALEELQGALRGQRLLNPRRVANVDEHDGEDLSPGRRRQGKGPDRTLEAVGFRSSALPGRNSPPGHLARRNLGAFSFHRPN